jgi:uncharacterized membrane protein
MTIAKKHMTIAKNCLPVGLACGVFALCTGPVSILWAGEHAKEFDLHSFDIPGSVFTSPQGINDAGDISGIFRDARGEHGFVLRRDDIMVIDYPGAAWTRVYGINAQGDIVGAYGRPGETFPLAWHGFLRSRNGQLTDVHYPGHLYELPQRITSTGIILGCYHDMDLMDSMHGFTRSPDGSFTGFSVPHSMHNGASPDGSRIVGLYDTHAYLINNGSFLSFDVPDSTLTFAYDMNPQVQIVGHFRDRSGRFHAFFRDEDGEFTVLDFPGSSNTQARGINARGDFVGWYVDSNGRTHGFFAQVRENTRQR